MPRHAYVNGRFVPHRAAAVHIEDRGYQFADGVYEVIPVSNEVLIDEDWHLDRLERSLRELRIAEPMSRITLKLVCRELIRRNLLGTGFLYMQVTRGVAPREHKFPKHARPALVMTTREMKQIPASYLEQGISVVTQPDIRWRRRDIKSISLLPNCLAKQAAYEAGAYEAWLVDEDGLITEGTSTNAWIVTDKGKLVTRDASEEILNGITRLRLIDLASQAGIDFEERPFSLDEAKRAREAFLTASSIFLLPVTSIDGRPVGNGHPGMLSRELRAQYLDFVEKGRGRA